MFGKNKIMHIQIVLGNLTGKPTLVFAWIGLVIITYLAIVCMSLNKSLVSFVFIAFSARNT